MGNKKDILIIVGENIREKRIKLNLTQDQLAYEAGVTREFVNKVESGKYNISLRNLAKLASVLNTDVKELF